MDTLALVFDVSGRMAHFRRFYSNVTSLSYTFPPRNTVIGMLAAILGYKRDSYYNVFSRENFGIAISINNRNGLRRLILPTNYLDTDNISITRLRGSGKVPTSIEYIVSIPPETEVSYRIYVILLNSEYEYVIKELERRVKQKEPVYPLSLGPANCLAAMDFVTFNVANIIATDNGGQFPIKTVIALDLVADDGIKLEGENRFEDIKIILEERLPPDFADGREIKGVSKNYIFEGRGYTLPIKLKPNVKVFKVNIKGEDTYGTFM